MAVDPAGQPELVAWESHVRHQVQVPGDPPPQPCRYWPAEHEVQGVQTTGVE